MHFLQTTILLLLLASSKICASQMKGEFDVRVLDEHTIALVANYTGFMQERYKSEIAPLDAKIDFKKKPAWFFKANLNANSAKIIIKYRTKIAKQLQDFSALQVGDLTIQSAGYWLNPLGQSRFDGKLTRNADVAHFLFIRLKEPLVDNTPYEIKLGTKEKISWIYKKDEQYSSLYKYNQVAYLPSARYKYAYLGTWLGTLGAMPLSQYIDKPFHIVDNKSKKIIFTAKIRPSFAPDPVNNDGAPFIGEETLILDFSKLTQSGEYYFEIEGIGRSNVFHIDSQKFAEAFYCHIRGLYHKRCGIAKTEPFTQWKEKSCHTTIFRGNFPPERFDYPANPKRKYGFFDSKNKPISVNHFNLITHNHHHFKEALSAAGGWHDAADHDRRPMHQRIVGDLLAAYLLNSEAFLDGQQNIPESQNGVADIIDEAAWGLKHLLATQQADGGVGAWIEAHRHPLEENHLPSNDSMNYYLSFATIPSSMEYAAYASMLAVVYQKIGLKKESDIYAKSARKAWEFAENQNNAFIKIYQYNGQTIIYKSSNETSIEFNIKAAVNLYLLFKEDKYLERISQSKFQEKSAKYFQNNYWRLSPLVWVELNLFEKELSQLAKLRQASNKTIIHEANIVSRNQDNNYPYNLAWFSATHHNVSTMSWGTYHPLKQALSTLAAYYITGKKHYLHASLLMNDNHNGANPMGTCMTSGLGQMYPTKFLDLTSYSDKIDEFVPGITPYYNTYGIARESVALAHGLYYKENRGVDFKAFAQSMLPLSYTKDSPLSLGENAKLISQKWPIFRRWANVEGLTVMASEYTVWETIAVAATATALMIEPNFMPDKKLMERKPIKNIHHMMKFIPLP